MKNLMLVWFSFLYNWPLLSVKGKLLGSSLYPWCSEISQCHIETWVFFHYFWGALEILFQFKNSFIFEKKYLVLIFYDVLSIFSIISFWNSCFHMRLIQRLLLVFPYIFCFCLLFSGRFAHPYLFFWIFYLATSIFKYQELFIFISDSFSWHPFVDLWVQYLHTNISFDGNICCCLMYSSIFWIISFLWVYFLFICCRSCCNFP